MITNLPVTTVTADAIKQDLINMLMTMYPDWTDQQDSNSMIMLLEALSALAELNYGYINRLARECFIQYALDPNNVYAHARGLGYIPQYQTSSTVTAVIQSASAVTADTTIPAGTQFSSILGAVYETVAAVLIRRGQSNSTPVILAQQQSWTDIFDGTNGPNQQYVLNQTPVMPSSLDVKVDGGTWSYVKNFVDNDATDPVYTWYIDGAGNCSIVFGNGVSGKKPALDAVISITYKTGGGSALAVPANGLSNSLSNVTDAGNNVLLSLTAYNAMAAVPGADAETVAQVKAHAIANLIAPAVLLTRADVEAAVTQLPGVQAAKVVNWENEPLLSRNYIQIFVMPVGGGTPSQNLLDSVTILLTQTKQLVMGVTPIALAPQYVTLDFNINLGVKQGYTKGAVENDIIAALVDMFDPTQTTDGFLIGFGQEVYMSQITSILQRVSGVNNVNITTPGDTPLLLNQFPLLGTITFA